MPIGRGRLILVLPGYTPGTSSSAESTALSPMLCKLLARAAWTAETNTTPQSLLKLFGHPPAVSLAALLARAELDLDATGWLRADPVHFRADAKLVMLIVPERDELNAEDADALLVELRARMPELDWRRGEDPSRCYVRMPDVGATPTLGPRWLHGRSLTPFFPQSIAHRRWRQYMTEVQMVLHAADLNVAREARGASPLNALWIWGGGSAPAAGEASVVLAVGHDLLLAGGALAAGVTWQDTADAGSLRTALARGDVLVMCGAPFGALDGNPHEVVAEANAVAGIAWAALVSGDAGSIELVGEQVRGRVTPAARWRVWQRAVTGRFGDTHAVSART